MRALRGGVVDAGIFHSQMLALKRPCLACQDAAPYRQEFARHLGLPVDQTLAMLAKFLPDIIDKASPNGVLKTS